MKTINIGERIKLLRKVNNLTQLELAKELFISYQLVSKWERGLSEPTADMMFTIIEKYKLTMDYFFDNPSEEQRAKEIALILEAFKQSMVESPSKRPSFAKIAQLANKSQVEIEKHFATFDDLIYGFINSVDKDIVGSVEHKIIKGVSIETIFICELAPILYENHFELNLLYTRPYISEVWKKFITSRYKQIILKNFAMDKSDSLTLEYIVSILMTTVSVWMREENPESLECFQYRIRRFSHGQIDQWLPAMPKNLD